jgi:3-phenylpropionate/cinnamic acid dioxygenase small subunit
VPENSTETALDRLLIEEVIGLSAGFLYDDGDFDKLSELWAEESVFDVTPKPHFTDMPLHGRDAIISMMRARQPEVYAAEPRRHLITNVTFDELTPDYAKCRSYMTLLSVLADKRNESLTLMGSATYYDELRRINGKWQLVYRLSALYGGSFSYRPEAQER